MFDFRDLAPSLPKRPTTRSRMQPGRQPSSDKIASASTRRLFELLPLVEAGPADWRCREWPFEEVPGSGARTQGVGRGAVTAHHAGKRVLVGGGL
jgi:hypothetical protein